MPYIPFFILKIPNKMPYWVLKTIDDVIYISDQLPKQWLTGKKEGKTEIQKVECLEKEKYFKLESKAEAD